MATNANVEHVEPELLRADLRQLLALLSDAHPDPFSAIGGMVSFHRMANDILSAIPDEGMTPAEFLRLLRPLVAAVRDGHTTIFDPAAPDQLVDVRAMGGELDMAQRLWIDWEPVDEQLVVSGVYDEGHSQFLGALLDSVEGVPFGELVKRMRAIRGDDNAYNNLVHLTEALGHPYLIFDLLECEPTEALTLKFIDRVGAQIEANVPLSPQPAGDRITPPSAIDLTPVGPSRIGWQMVDGAMLLRVGPMMWYREAFEVWRHYGYHHNLSHHLDTLVEDLGVYPRPCDVGDRIAAVPAASEIFVQMLEEMAKNATKTLIVDLRESTGGNSTIATILQFLLYGLNGMIDHDGGYQVRRLSPLFFDNNRNIPRESSTGLPGGYDFSEEREWRRGREGLTDQERRVLRDRIIEEASASKTFERLIATRDENPSWTPEVIVLTSARTYSAGFDMAAMLYKHGAKIVGVPSSQAGNCFIDTLRYTLDHSGLQGRISYKWSLLFPDDADTGKMLRPNLELTYDRLADLDFDPNASIQLALDLIPKG